MSTVPGTVDAAPGKPPKRTVDKEKDAPEPPPEEDDPGVRECEAHLRGGDAGEAISCAKKVLADRPRSGAALVVLGKAHCADDDQERAQTVVNKLGRRKALAAAVKKYCKRKGFELN
jgi:hypothetical protein